MAKLSREAKKVTLTVDFANVGAEALGLGFYHGKGKTEKSLFLANVLGRVAHGNKIGNINKVTDPAELLNLLIDFFKSLDG